MQKDDGFIGVVRIAEEPRALGAASLAARGMRVVDGLPLRIVYDLMTN
jgi:hypothetical protein